MGNVNKVQNTTTIAEPWSLRPNYTLTSAVVNSNKTLAKVAKYTGVTVAILAIAETIKGLVAIPFKVLGNLFGLYKFPMLKAPRVIEIDTKSNNAKMSTWKKAALAVGALLGFVALTYGGVKLYPYARNMFANDNNQQDMLNSGSEQAQTVQATVNGTNASNPSNSSSAGQSWISTAWNSTTSWFSSVWLPIPSLSTNSTNNTSFANSSVVNASNASAPKNASSASRNVSYAFAPANASNTSALKNASSTNRNASTLV